MKFETLIIFRTLRKIKAFPEISMHIRNSFTVEEFEASSGIYINKLLSRIKSFFNAMAFLETRCISGNAKAKLETSLILRHLQKLKAFPDVPK